MWSLQLESRIRDLQMMIPRIRTIVADDQRFMRETLRLWLASEPEVEVVAECGNAAETIRAVLSHKPELLLLDITILDADGLRILNDIPAKQRPIVVFMSSDDQNATRAFEARALDYLLKPFNQQRLHTAVERTRLELFKADDRHLTHRILDLLAEAKNESHADRRLVIKASGRVVLLDMAEIDWVEAAGNYVQLKAGKESYLLREGIGQISKRLDPDQFVRIHRSTIVNFRRIKELQPCNNGEYMVVLKDGKELSCSRSYRSHLQHLIAAS